MAKYMERARRNICIHDAICVQPLEADGHRCAWAANTKRARAQWVGGEIIHECSWGDTRRDRVRESEGPRCMHMGAVAIKYWWCRHWWRRRRCGLIMHAPGPEHMFPGTPPLTFLYTLCMAKGTQCVALLRVPRRRRTLCAVHADEYVKRLNRLRSDLWSRSLGRLCTPNRPAPQTHGRARVARVNKTRDRFDESNECKCDLVCAIHRVAAQNVSFKRRTKEL
jgi:hypothetical protein